MLFANKKKIERLLLENIFSAQWENDIWEEIKSLTELLSNKPDDWLLSIKATLYATYMGKIKEAIEKMELARASELIDNAYKYATDSKPLNAEKARLAELIKALNEKTRLSETERARIAELTKGKVETSKKINTDFIDLHGLNLC